MACATVLTNTCDVHVAIHSSMFVPKDAMGVESCPMSARLTCGSSRKHEAIITRRTGLACVPVAAVLTKTGCCLIHITHRTLSSLVSCLPVIASFVLSCRCKISLGP